MPTVALFTTCLVDQVHPEIGIATVRLLKRAGFEVAFPAAQTCCGQPFFNSGYIDEARRLAARTIEIFEPFDAVVLPSGSCAAMLRVEYAHMLHDEPAWAARAGALAAKTFELSEFLDRVGGDVPSPNPLHAPTAGSETTPGAAGESHAGTAAAAPAHRSTPATSARTESGPTASAPAASAPTDTPPVTYHDSCHMCRLTGLRDEPRAALCGAVVPIVEMEESDRCCGFGGTFSVKMPEVSAAMTHEKLRRAAATGAKTLVTADPGCLMQMRRFAGEHGITVEHLAVVLDGLGRTSPETDPAARAAGTDAEAQP